MNYVEHPEVYNVKVRVPEGYKLNCEFILPQEELEYIRADVNNVYWDEIVFERLSPSEFHIYEIEEM